MANPYDLQGKRLKVGYRVAYADMDGVLHIARIVEHPDAFNPYKLDTGTWRWGSELVVLEEPLWPNS